MRLKRQKPGDLPQIRETWQLCIILFKNCSSTVNVDGMADKFIMSSSWPRSKFNVTNAARAIQISLALRPLF